MQDKIRAIGLFSGGLDSLLAAKIMMEQGIDARLLYFSSPFSRKSGFPPEPDDRLIARDSAGQIGLPLRVEYWNQDLFERVVIHPKYGRGSAMNACIDCRIEMLARTKEIMKSEGADFVFTGEVLGQRPMSQRKDAMRLVEKKSGLQGLLLRPLSCRILPETIPEREGWVDRNALLGIQGRGRGPQMKLAEKYGISDYPNPGGGCMLTEPDFSYRLMKLLDEFPGADIRDAGALRYGRQFFLHGKAHAMVGRNEYENEMLEKLFREGDFLLIARDTTGPTAILRGGAAQREIELAAGLILRYAKHTGSNRGVVLVRKYGCEETSEIEAKIPMESEIRSYIAR